MNPLNQPSPPVSKDTLQHTITFKAWIGSIDIPVPPQVQEFTEALSGLVPRCTHRDVLTILREDAGRAQKELRFYIIRKSTRRGHWRQSYDGGPKVFVGNLEPHLLHAIAVREFEPVEAFDAFRDDPVGIDRTLIEQA